MSRVRRHHECERYCMAGDDDFYSLASTAPLDRRTELELFTRRRTASPEERERIDDQVIRANIRWATVQAARTACDVPFSLLRAAAVRGLHLALGRYDVEMGVRFLSYARWWIKHSLQEEMQEHQELPVRLPTTVMRTRWALAEARAAAPHASLEQLLDDIDCRGDEREAILISMAGHLYLDAPAPQTNAERTNQEALAAPHEPEEDCWCDQLPDPVSAIQEALAAMPERTRWVVAAMFGLDGQEPMTSRQVADRLGLTRQRVHQIRCRGLEQLRRVMIASHDQLRQAVEAAGAIEATGPVEAARPEEN